MKNNKIKYVSKFVFKTNYGYCVNNNNELSKKLKNIVKN